MRSVPKTNLVDAARKVVRPRLERFLVRNVLGREYNPAPGRVDWGDFRSLEPISRDYGYGRGRPVDRYYIETFLEANAQVIRGTVFEIGDNTYTMRFGGDRVEKSVVLHASESAHWATYIGDLTDAPDIPTASLDCVILTQTLQLIYDLRAALATVYRTLKPGGVLLATFPGITQIADEDWNDTWHWGLTRASAEALLRETFGPEAEIKIEHFGNVLTSIAFLEGLAEEELTREELAFSDPEYQMLLAVTARKPLDAPAERVKGRWQYEGRPQFAYDDDQSYRKGIEFLDGHGTIEDWGCGTAYAKTFVAKSAYVGLDGSESEFVDKVVDLQAYRSSPDCIFMRHVLEHNYGWRAILANAVASFRKRMVLVLFTPYADKQTTLTLNDGIPDLSLPRSAIIEALSGCLITEESIKSATEYGQETIFYIRRADETEAESRHP